MEMEPQADARCTEISETAHKEVDSPFNRIKQGGLTRNKACRREAISKKGRMASKINIPV